MSPSVARGTGVPPLPSSDALAGPPPPANAAKRAGTDPETSDAIRVARVLCILFMMTVHAWPGGEMIMETNAGTALEPFYHILIDVLGHASVPLLSYFSGRLLFVTLSRGRRRRVVIRDKMLTLYWPMMFWSAMMVPIILAEDLLRTGAIDPSRTPIYWVGQILGIGGGPANSPLHFFREIVVMCLYATALQTVARFSRLLAVAAFVAVARFELRDGASLMARHHVFVFFTAGMTMAMAGRADRKPGWRAVAVLLAAYGASRVFDVQAAFDGQHWPLLLADVLDRAAVSSAMFLATILVVRHGRGLRQAAFWLEPRFFTIYCTHRLTISMFGGVAFSWAGARGTPPIPCSSSVRSSPA